MDSYEATKIVFSRIQALDSENASKIMGFLLLNEDQCGKQMMIRLAFGPDTLLENLIFNAKTQLGLFLSSSSPTSTCSPSYANVVSRNTKQASGPSFNGSSSASELVDNLQFSFLNDQRSEEDIFDGGLDGVYGTSSLNKQSYSAFGSEDHNSYELGWKPSSYFARGSYSDASSLAYNKCLNLLMQQNEAHVSLMMEEELHHKFGRYQHERYDVSNFGGYVIPSSRQIYLTFPSDSSFSDEDVSAYFNVFGPVQDVRIPYQQKRMFGFVTFVYSETVRIILAKGNPHFICDSRVLVKPYKEKGKLTDKKMYQHLETGRDSREPFDFNLGSRMYYSSQEMMFRRKLEDQVNLEHAIGLQEKRLVSMQLLGIKNNNQHQYYQALSEGFQFPSPILSHTPKNQSPTDVAEDGEHQEKTKSAKDQPIAEEFGVQESVEHNLPDNLFASPAVARDHINVFPTASAQLNDSTSATSSSSNTNGNSNNNNLLPTTSASTSNATSPKSVLSTTGFLLGMEPLECNKES